MVAVFTLLVMVEKSVWGVWWLWSGSPEKVMKNTFTSVQTTGVENHDSLHLMGQKKDGVAITSVGKNICPIFIHRYTETSSLILKVKPRGKPLTNLRSIYAL